MKLCLVLSVCLFVALCAPAPARGVSPYLPLNLEPEVERQIERLMLLADMPVLTRPIPAAAVLDALDAGCKLDSLLCEQVRGYLQRYMGDLGVTHLSLAAGSGSDRDVTVPNRRGLGSSSEWLASAMAYWQPSDFLSLSLGAVAYDGEVTPAGSFVSLGFERAQLDIGYRDHWLSPFTDSSLLIGTEAPTMPSVTLSNYTPMTRFGLRYQIFLARMSRSDEIEFRDGLTAGNPRLLGMHWSIEPARGWSLGVNRLMQFGGGERGNSSFRRILKAFIRPSTFDNASATLGSSEFGNQLASVTSSFLFPGRVPFSVYLEYAGEDTSRGRSYLLGNAALSGGIHFPSLWRGLDLTYETSTWQNAWYVNHIYGDGLTNKGHVIGHWFGDQRAPGDDVGGESHMLSLGWQPLLGGAFELRLRTLSNENYSAVDYDTARDVTLRYSHPVGAFNLGAELLAGRDVFGDNFSQAGLFINLGALAPVRSERSGPADRQGAEVFVDAGLNANKVKTDLAREIPVESSGLQASGHFAIGARRAVSARSDLGVRLEADDIDAHTLIGFRAIDYRYRFTGPLAIGGFLGAARYDLATPAYGIYGGVGAQWRDVMQGWDLGLDLRYATKVARDRLLTSDPPSERPDQFYDISSATLYLSRRF